MKSFSEEIIRRIESSRKKQKQRRIYVFSTVSMLLTCVMGVLVTTLSRTSEVSSSKSVMGAFLLGPQAGGYVLIAISAFLAGVLLCKFLEHRRKPPEIQEEETSFFQWKKEPDGGKQKSDNNNQEPDN